MSFLLKDALLNPQSVCTLNNTELNQLLSQARNSRLLAALGVRLADSGVLESLPYAASRHWTSGVVIHEKQRRDLHYECEKILAVLAPLGEKLVLLKGAAYILGNLTAGRGRLVTDIDIITPEASLARVEAALKQAGWRGSPMSAYDEHYYREWGHEIPPLTHRKRGTTLDVHHNILPPTSDAQVDASILWENLLEVQPGVYTLSHQDIVIHSATHLFHEGEFHHGLRDLWDIDRMLRDFPRYDSDFWNNLVPRAQSLGLTGSLYHALSYSAQVFNTPIPKEVLTSAESPSRRLRKPIMDFLFKRAFTPDPVQRRLPFRNIALFALYIRSHYLRMPLYLLLPHLIRKAWKKQLDTDHSELERGKEAGE